MRVAHVGIALLPAARGHSYGRDAVTIICRYGFRLRLLRRIELETGATNTAMRTVAERVGFTLEGMLRERYYDGTGFGDVALYGLLDREWRDPAEAS
jgi:RimJ/RimL family protein N-acetyltransferase